MQRITTSRFRARNIFGDRTRVKLYFVKGEQVDVLGATNNLVVRTFPFNSMQSIVNAFGTTPNLYALSNLYEYYRIRGIKITTRVWPATVNEINSVNQTVPPFLFGFNAVTDNQSFPAANVQNFQEQRWAKARLCSNANQGAKPVTVSVYYSVNKVYGPDRVTRNDTTFIGTINQGATPTYNAPSNSPELQQVLFTMTGNNLTANVNVALLHRVTVYAEFWGKVPTTE